MFLYYTLQIVSEIEKKVYLEKITRQAEGGFIAYRIDDDDIVLKCTGRIHPLNYFLYFLVGGLHWMRI